MDNNRIAAEGKIWKVSIPKQELSELPAATFEGEIVVVDTVDDANAAAVTLMQESEIGFDTETKPSFRRGQHHTVALLQLSTRNVCFLFRLNNIGLPKSIADILESNDVKKIGVSVHDDFLNLHKTYKLNPAGFIDLQDFVKQFNISDNSLSRIYGILFGKRISKGQRLSNWEAPTLTLHQKEYAALDALACLHIYDHLLSHGFNFEDSQYYREYDDPNFPKK